MSENFDLVVIGGGPGGYVAAIKAAQIGLKVCCVEKRKDLGGTCLNIGCIPSKFLLEASHKFYDAKNNFSKLGIDVGDPKIDLKKLMKNKLHVVEGLTRGISGLFKKNKVHHIIGEGIFLDKNTLEIVNSDFKQGSIKSKNFIIATGSEVCQIPSITIDEEFIISSEGALKLKKIPKKMLVVGAGVIGLEMASIWSRFGTEIDIVEFSNRILFGMDGEISKQFKKILEKENFNFYLSSKLLSAKVANNQVKVEIEINSKEVKKDIYDVVLVSVGRKPNSANLNLKKLGIEIDERGFILNKKLKTNIDNIYAIGDVTHGPMLAHKAEEEGVAAVELIAGQKPHVNYDIIPSVVYTYPEIASVGRTEEELKLQNIDYNVGKFPMIANSRSRATQDSVGMVKILSCTKTDKVLGVHIISREAGNMIHEVVVAMEFSASAEDIARTCHAHPTYNEAIKEAALAVNGSAIHI